MALQKQGQFANKIKLGKVVEKQKPQMVHFLEQYSHFPEKVTILMTTTIFM